MKSQNIILEVVPLYGREQYEKSVIAPLYSPNKAEHISKGKFPPAAHPKLMMKDPDFSEANNLETVTHASPKSPNFSRINKKPPSPSLSPLIGFGSKKNAKKIRIDLKKGKLLWVVTFQIGFFTYGWYRCIHLTHSLQKQLTCYLETEIGERLCRGGSWQITASMYPGLFKKQVR